MPKITVEVVDVNGSLARLIKEAPKACKKFLSTAVFLTAGSIQRVMEADAPLGPTGEGRTPTEHIKFDIEHRGRTGSLVARVGIFDNPDQIAVATYNEYQPNQQKFMKPSAEARETEFHERATSALKQMERYLSQGF